MCGAAATVAGAAAEAIPLGRRLAWFNGYEPGQSTSLYVTDGTTVARSFSRNSRYWWRLLKPGRLLKASPVRIER